MIVVGKGYLKDKEMCMAVKKGSSVHYLIMREEFKVVQEPFGEINGYGGDVVVLDNGLITVVNKETFEDVYEDIDSVSDYPFYSMTAEMIDGEIYVRTEASEKLTEEDLLRLAVITERTVRDQVSKLALKGSDGIR